MEKVKENQYLLDNFNPTEELPRQNIIFYEMREGERTSNGTTIEDLLEVSIDRLNFLNSKFGCRENSIAITKMQEALMWLNERTRERTERGVEGKHEA